MYPKVSIIIPVYNVKNYLRQCVDSVLHQKFNDFEVLLIDDGSTDGSAAICDEYAVMDNRIKTVHKENGGLSSARNRGIELAEGIYICFLDSDDYWETDSFLSDVLNKTNDEDVVLFRLKKYVEKSGKTIESIPPVVANLPQDKNKLLGYLIEHGQYTASACTKMVKKKLLTDNNILFRQGVTSEDIEWSGKILLFANSFVYVDLAGYIYRQRKSSITSTMTEQNIADLKNNIIYSIDDAENTLKRTEMLYALYMSYIAYQFSTLILCAHNVKGDMYTKISDMKKYTYVLKYSCNKKVKIFCLLEKIIGFRGLYLVSGLYMKYLFNRI